MSYIDHDLRTTFRALARRPGFTMVVIFSMALGIGANTTVFTLVKEVLFHTLPIPESDRLVAVYGAKEEAGQDGVFNGFLSMSYPNFQDYRGQNEVFSDMVTWHGTFVGLSGGRGEPQQTMVEIVSGNYFELCRIQPALGRFFLPEEDQTPGSHPVAVLNYNLWSTRFGADRDVLGKTVTLNDQPFTVIGVAPQGFKGFQMTHDVGLWVPNMMFTRLAGPPLNRFFDHRAGRMFFVTGRLKDGVSLKAARSAMNAIAARLEQEYPNYNHGRGVNLLPLSLARVNPAQRQMFVRAASLIAVVAGILLFIACANVANLMLNRAADRRRETAVRLSLGASRARLIRHSLTESVTLSLLGGLASLPVAYWTLGLLWRSKDWLQTLHGVPMFADDSLDLSIDFGVLLFTFAVALGVGLLVGLMPALQALKSDMVPELKGQASSFSLRRLNLRNLLVTAQVALSVLALIGAGLFLRSLKNAQQIDPGFLADKTAMLTFKPGNHGYDQQQSRQLYRQVIEQVESLPGIESATLAEVAPLTVTFFRNIYAQGAPEDETHQVMHSAVSRGYFETMGIPVLSGRDFRAEDREGATLVAVVNQTLAQAAWPGQDPIGRQFGFPNNDPFTVVGVARDAKYVQLGEDPRAYFYLPLEQKYVPGVTLLYRSSAEPSGLLPVVLRNLRQIAPELPLIRPATLQERIQSALWAPRLGAALLSAYGLLILLLSAVGVYGVMAYSVRQRFQEIGLRMALGARRLDVLQLILRQGMLIAALGIGLGLLLALLLERSIYSLLYGVDSSDPATLTITALVLAAVALLASCLPAFRASRVDPKQVLRYE